MDGGIRSCNNADLMTGQQTVLVLAPLADTHLAAELETLRATGTVLAVTPDEDSLTAFGTNPLDTAVRAPSARAGHAQARRIADLVRDFWA